jgi:hypothetical protein
MFNRKPPPPGPASLRYAAVNLGGYDVHAAVAFGPHEFRTEHEFPQE